MNRIAVLTSSARGFASLCLPRLVSHPDIEIAAVILCGSRTRSLSKRLQRTLRKVTRIGMLGALNGKRMRRWYKHDAMELVGSQDLDQMARAAALNFATTPHVNSEETMSQLSAANCDIALSLGNGYIAERVFSLPRNGTINVHHELLPQYRGASSIIWPIYYGMVQSGYTIHQIDRSLDTGKILYQEEIEIEFMHSLRETVTHNYARLLHLSTEGVAEVAANYQNYAATAHPQGKGFSYTTPSFRQYLRMLRQHKKLRKQQNNNAHPH